MKIRHIALTAVVSSATTLVASAYLSSPELRHQTGDLFRTLAQEIVVLAPTPGDHDDATPPLDVVVSDLPTEVSKGPGDRPRIHPKIAGRQPCAIEGTRFKSTADAEQSQSFPAYDEVHAVGIYEADVTPAHFRGVKSRDRVPVCIDRPGKSVLLLLGSYEPVRWQLQVSPDTTLSGVVLQGHGARASEANFYGRYSDDSRPAHMVTPEVKAPHTDAGPVFRTYARMMPDRYGVERLASHDGAYTAPLAGFRIDQVEEDANLDPDPLAGQISGHDLLTPQLKWTLEHGAPGQGWRFDKEGFFGAGSEPAIAPPAEIDISWPIDTAAFDEKSNRVFGLSSHVYSRVYRGDLQTGEMILLAETRSSKFGGAIWSPGMNKLVVTGLSRGASKAAPEFSLVDAETGDMEIVRFQPEDFPGLTDLVGSGPLPPLESIAVDGHLAVVKARSGHHHPAFSRPDEHGSRTWLVDLTSRDVHLLSYQVDRTEESKIERRARDERMRAARDEAQRADEARRAAIARALAARHQEHESADAEAGADTEEKRLRTVREIEAAISGTRALFAARDSYFGLNRNLLVTAGKLADSTHDWGGEITAHGGTEQFTITYHGMPESECEAIKEGLPQQESIVAALCRDGSLRVVAQ